MNKRKLFQTLAVVALLLTGVLTVITVQNRQSVSSRAAGNTIQLQCSQNKVVLSYSFTNPESYAVDIAVQFSDDQNDPVAEVVNIPTGQTRTGTLATGKPSLPSGTAYIDWYPTDPNSQEDGDYSEHPFAAINCTAGTTTAPGITTTVAPTSVAPTSTSTITPTVGPTLAPGAAKTAADLNDDGNVNQIDYNLFLREINTQPGQ